MCLTTCSSAPASTGSSLSTCRGRPSSSRASALHLALVQGRRPRQLAPPLAGRRSVARLRTRRICVELPVLACQGLDCSQAHPNADTGWAGGSASTSARHSARCCAAPTDPALLVLLWGPSCRHWLTSATVGVQESQVRRAAVPSWEGQLCFAADGTLEDRRCCDATLPAEVWVDPPNAMRSLVDRIGPDRARLLRTCALFVLRVAPWPRTSSVAS